MNFLNHYPCLPSWPGVFLIVTFLSVALIESWYIFTFGPSSSPCNSFPILLIHCFSVMFSSFPYFAPKLFCFLVIQLLVCVRAFSSYLLKEFFRSFRMLCFILPRYLFSLLSFASTFWFISSSCTVCFTC